MLKTAALILAALTLSACTSKKEAVIAGEWDCPDAKLSITEDGKISVNANDVVLTTDFVLLPPKDGNGWAILSLKEPIYPLAKDNVVTTAPLQGIHLYPEGAGYFPMNCTPKPR